jgi:hypothetical protein
MSFVNTYIYEAGHLEQRGVGAVFPARPYYPLLAANGTDAILIGLAGFPDDPNWRCYSMQLPSRASLGWYKTARKDYLYANRRYGVSSYGTSVALAAPTTLLTVGKENNLGVRHPQQFFDPRKRVLTTTFELHESRGTVPAKIRVTTFLTDEHLLIEHYEVLQAPQSGFRLGFQLDTPNATDLDELCVYPQATIFETMPAGFRFRYSYESPEIPDGVAATWTDAGGCEIEWEGKRPVIERTPILPEGATLTHYVAVVDAGDAPDFCGEVDRLREKTLALGYEEILREHLRQADARRDVARVHLPEKALEYLYEYSLYVLDASFDRASGFLPMGILPTCWQNAMFWDSWFASMAWLGSNRGDRAKKLSEFYRNKLPEARMLAQEMNCGGARFAWTTNRDHFEPNAERVMQFHNNAVIALQCLQVYEFFGDEEFLREYFDVVEQALIFLTEKLVRIEDGVACLRDCAGLDESTSDLKGTDTWTAATYVKALELYLEACQKLRRPPFQPTLDEIAVRVREALGRNVDAEGVLQSFAGGLSPHWGSLIFHLFPDHASRHRTIDALSKYDTELDSYNSHGVAGYRGRIFTWTEFWIARILASDELPAGWERLRQCAKFADVFGSFPERVFYHGELLKQPFLSAHAAYLWAVNSLLVNRRGERLAVLTNLPEGWADLSFENITTPDGLKASATLEKSRISHLEIVNLNQETHTVHLALPGEAVRVLALQPGETFCFEIEVRNCS